MLIKYVLYNIINNLPTATEFSFPCLTRVNELTHPEKSVNVCLFSPLIFQILMVLSIAPEMIILLSVAKHETKTSLVCPLNNCLVLNVFKSHNLRVLSQLDEITKLLSFEILTDETKCECPFRLLKGFPTFLSAFLISLSELSLCSSSFSRSRFHTIRVLSLEPEIRRG